MATSLIPPKFYGFDPDTGKPLRFGKVYTYEVGTSVPKPTYKTESGRVENENPVILNAEGYASIKLIGSYKVVLTDANDVEVWTEESVSSSANRVIDGSSVPPNKLPPLTPIDNALFIVNSDVDQGGVDWEYLVVGGKVVADREYAVGTKSTDFILSALVASELAIAAKNAVINSADDGPFAGNFATREAFDAAKPQGNGLYYIAADETNGGAEWVVFHAGAVDVTEKAYNKPTGLIFPDIATLKIYSATLGTRAQFFRAGTGPFVAERVAKGGTIDEIILLDGGAGGNWKVESVSREAYGFDPLQATSILLNGVAASQNGMGGSHDKHIMLFGDSHSWGQGGPNWDEFSGKPNFSRHSAFVYSNGYMAKIKRYITEKRGINEQSYCLSARQQAGRIYPDQAAPSDVQNPRGVYPLEIEYGKLTGSVSLLTDITANTSVEFYDPLARNEAALDNDFREKLSVGLFSNTMMTLEAQDVDGFNPRGLDTYHEITPDIDYTASGASYTSLLTSTGAIIAERHNTNDWLFLVGRNRDYPGWLVVGKVLFMAGYGFVEVVARIANGGIQLKNWPSGTEIADAADGAIHAGMRLYPADIVNRSALSLTMQKAGRVSYVSVRHQANGGRLKIGFVDNDSGGRKLLIDIDVLVADTKQRANDYSVIPAGAVPSITLVKAGGVIATATAATKSVTGVVVDTGELTAATDEEVVYRIDWGSQQKGVLWLENLDAATGLTVETRGVVWDNNKVTNFAMGAHTVGAWIGTQQVTGGGEQADHVADILNYTPARTSHVVAQLPLVNEYINQTPIANFKANLDSFASKLTTHYNTTNNGFMREPDFIFFTTLRNREILFSGAAESAITYDDYTTASKQWCAANGAAFVDIEPEFVRLFKSGESSFNRFYADSNHPSDFANTVIFDQLKKHIDYAL